MMAELAALRTRVAELEAGARGKPPVGGPAASAGRLRAENAALKQECDALRLLLNQIRSYAPKIPDEARAWAEKQ